MHCWKSFFTICHTAAWPSGKAEVCNTFIPSSNLGAAFKKMNKLISISLFLFVLFKTFIVAAGINNLSITVHDSNLENINLNDYPGTTFKFCTVNISNSNANGFFFIINSANGQHEPNIGKSKFLREFRNTTKTLLGDYHYYSFYLTPPSGSIENPNTLTINNALQSGSIYEIPLNGQNIKIAYDALPSNAITNASFDIYIESYKNDKLFRGNFYDTISFTLQDI